jgi:hypothetical protein
MVELILIILVALAVTLTFLVLTSIFLAYATQANYIDPLHEEKDEE